MWKEAFKNFSFEDNGTIIPVLGISLNEGPAIDITHIGLALGPQQIKPANILLKLLHNLRAQELLLGRQDNRKPLLLPTLIPINNPIKSR